MRGIASWGDVNRRRIGGTRSRTSAALLTSSARGRATSTSRGIRSWSSSSVASTIGSAWKRSTIDPVVEDVAEGDQRHPLVVGHVALDDGDRRALGKPARRVVERLAEAVRPAAARRAQAGEVPHRGLGLDHRREAGGVRGDDEILAQAALQAEAGHAEARVLVGLLEVAGVEPRFGDAPRHAALGGVARIWRATTSRYVLSSRLRAGARMTSAGIRYSNIEPDHEISAEPRPTGVSARPSRNQWSAETSPLAIARKLASRASEARRS